MKRTKICIFQNQQLCVMSFFRALFIYFYPFHSSLNFVCLILGLRFFCPFSYFPSHFSFIIILHCLLLPLNYLERRPTFILLAKFDLLVMGSSSAFHSHFGLTRLQIYPIIQYIQVILITCC